MKGKWQIALLAVGLVLLALAGALQIPNSPSPSLHPPKAGPVQALGGSTFTMTSTADFDAGTKSSSGVNYGIETNSDNLGIASGSFELGSGKGDSFTLADA